MKNILKGMVVLVLLAVILQTGCASNYVYQNAKKRVAMKKAEILPEPAHNDAVRAIKINGGAAVGIDVSSWEAVKEAGWEQIIAAIVDAGIVIGAKEAIESLNDNNGGDTVTVNITDGSNHDVDIDIDSGNTTTSSQSDSHDSSNSTSNDGDGNSRDSL